MRFTVRDLLWLTVVAVVTLVWWIDRSRLAEKLRRMESREYKFDQPDWWSNPLEP